MFLIQAQNGIFQDNICLRLNIVLHVSFCSLEFIFNFPYTMSTEETSDANVNESVDTSY